MSGHAPSLFVLFVSDWQPAWAPDLLATVATVTYLLATTRIRGRWPIRRSVAFAAGVVSVLVALQSGIGSYDDALLSAHMVQHMLLLLLAPLLLLCGQPAMLALLALSPPHRRTLAGALGATGRRVRPLGCLALFYVVLLLTHVPGVYDATLSNPSLHDLEHALYLTAGLLLWWPMLDADPAPSRRLGGFGRLIYMLAAMPPMALIGAYLNRHPSLVYPAYGAPGRSLGISALADQQQAGAIMWVAGNTIMVAVGLWAVLMALVAEERRRESREARATPAGGGLA